MKPKKVLFLCPHAAAKSVIAMTYFGDLAKKAGLHVAVSNGGTEPDETINPKVRQFLNDEGYSVGDFAPPLLSKDHLKTADIVVSIGCISPDEVPSTAEFHDWSDVPMLSEDFNGSRDKILAHVNELIAQLSTRPAASS